MGGKHLWHDEIVAWAAGEEIQVSSRDKSGTWSSWTDEPHPGWFTDGYVMYRVKPEKKEIGFEYRLYVYKFGGTYYLGLFTPGACYNPEKDSSFVKWLDEDYKEIRTEVE